MFRYIIQRLGVMIPTLLVISFLVFVIIQAPPGDYLSTYMAELTSQGFNLYQNDGLALNLLGGARFLRLEEDARVRSTSSSLLGDDFSAVFNDSSSTLNSFYGGQVGLQTDRVYGRARKPCRKCATPIRVVRIGPYARLTYYCPRCQPVAATY